MLGHDNNWMKWQATSWTIVIRFQTRARIFLHPTLRMTVETILSHTSVTWENDGRRVKLTTPSTFTMGLTSLLQSHCNNKYRIAVGCPLKNTNFSCLITLVSRRILLQAIHTFVLLIVCYPHPPTQQNHAVCGNVVNLIIAEDWLNTILNRMTSYTTNFVTLSTLLGYPNEF